MLSHESFEKSLSSRTIAVIGGGVTGEAVIRFLQTLGVHPIVVDEKSEIVAGIPTTKVAPVCDLAILSPGWKPTHPIISSLRSAGTEILSEIDFAWRIKEERAPHQKWVAITGTNGKTTTTQMLESIFEKSGIRATVCGNVGRTVVEVVSQAEPYVFLGLELSSFQIEWSNEAHFSASAILNIAEDHVDWHGSFEEYAKAKLKLLSHSDLAILNGDDPELAVRTPAIRGEKVLYSLETPGAGEIGLVENLLVDRAFVADPMHAESFAELADIKPTVPHNVSNACAAAALALALGLTHSQVKSGLSAFILDHHRMELVLEHDGISWINDSKATNPHAAAASIMSHHNVIWIAGGLAKGADMDPLIARVCVRLKKVIVIGSDGPLIISALAKQAPQIPVLQVEKNSSSENFMDEIVRVAKDIAEAGDVVLLAPACASMDQFISYAQRGSLFVDSVRRIVGEA